MDTPTDPVDLQRQIERLDKRIDKLNEQTEALEAERVVLYQTLIEDAANKLNELRVKAGVTPVRAARQTAGFGFAQPTKGRALNDDQVRDVRRRFAMGVTKKRLALDYGVSSIVIDKIVVRATYVDVPDEAPDQPTEQPTVAPTLVGVPVGPYNNDGEDEDEADETPDE